MIYGWEHEILQTTAEYRSTTLLQNLTYKLYL